MVVGGRRVERGEGGGGGGGGGVVRPHGTVLVQAHAETQSHTGGVPRQASRVDPCGDSAASRILPYGGPSPQDKTV